MYKYNSQNSNNKICKCILIYIISIKLCTYKYNIILCMNMIIKQFEWKIWFLITDIKLCIHVHVNITYYYV